MHDRSEQLRLPRSTLARWLVDPGGDLPPAIRNALVQGLYATLPIFIGGAVNAVAVSTLIAWRHPEPLFIFWAGLEIALMLTRLPVLIVGRRSMGRNSWPMTDIYLFLSLIWAASVGFGAFISITSGDWVSATLACLSAAAMVGGICFRNFGAPRLVAVMILLSLGPCMIGGVVSGEPILLVAAFQIPAYLFSMTMAAFKLNRMLVTTMQAERENAHRACHDKLTGLLNRNGLEREIEGVLGRQDSAATLFFLDLDGFKKVNDNYGHAAGDSLLQVVAQRLRLVSGPEDAIARIGGDEFVIVSTRERQSASGFARAVIAALAETWYDLDEGVATIGVSIGGARSPDHGNDLESLLAAADAALYSAKAGGRSRYVMAASPRAGQIAIVRADDDDRQLPLHTAAR